MSSSPGHPVYNRAYRVNVYSAQGVCLPSRTRQTLSGSIVDFPLLDLMQFIAGCRKSGTLSVCSAGGTGHISFTNGVVAAAYMDAPFARFEPLKALYRIFTFTFGSFVFDLVDVLNVPISIGGDTTVLLMDAARRIDENRELLESLPLSAQLQLRTPLAVPLNRLSRSDLAVLQGVLEKGSVQAVLDAVAEPDLETLRRINRLIGLRILSLAAPSDH